MGKVYPVSTKYTIHADIEVDGSIKKSDIVGAIFGQTEGLLGEGLELRDLQKGGRVGRIEVKIKSKKNDKTSGSVVVPSSLAKAETAIIAASLETIERIGPCNAEIEVTDIKDVRYNKREKIKKRAEKLLKDLNLNGADSQAIMKQVRKGFRSKKIIQWGSDNLTASEDIHKASEVILVEGRGDVVNLLRYKFGGLLSINGVKVPKSIKKILHSKTCTLFIDGDRGGSLIFNKVNKLGGLDYVAVAPDGKEVEELTGKEIHQCLRHKVKASEYKPGRKSRKRKSRKRRTRPKKRKSKPKVDKNRFKSLMNDLFGTRGAYLLDGDDNIIAKVPAKELKNALKDVDDVDTILLDGNVDRGLVQVANNQGVKNIVSKKIKTTSKNVNLIQF